MVASLATFEQLPLMFTSLIKQTICKGFVLGQAIYQQPLEQWLTQKISDDLLIEEAAILMWR